MPLQASAFWLVAPFTQGVASFALGYDWAFSPLHLNPKPELMIFLGGSLALLIIVEVALRLIWGFGKMPLFAASDKWEYMALPNQSGVRLGYRYYYNAFGMRSDEVNPHNLIFWYIKTWYFLGCSKEIGVLLQTK